MGSVEADSRPPLTIEVSAHGRAMVVNLSGELDLSNVATLQECLDEALRSDPEELVFDLADLSFLDSSGIGLIIKAASRVASVHVRRPSEVVRQVIQYMGLTGILSIDP
jgi:anti-sigma B factor antagonist